MKILCYSITDGITVVIGILMSALLAFPLATASGWRFLFAVTALLALLMLALSPYLLESPRWLLSHSHNVAAGEVIRVLQGLRDDVSSLVFIRS
jgi:SP family facilitated glucose transporter-like MFS transporter 3